MVYYFMLTKMNGMKHTIAFVLDFVPIKSVVERTQVPTKVNTFLNASTKMCL